MSSEEQSRQWRKEQRARLLAERLTIPRESHRAACAAITRTLAEDLLPQIAAKIVGAYSPIRGEYDCRPLLSALHRQGVKLALPVIAAKDAPLEFHAWKPGDLMQDGPMNIPQPSKAAPVIPDCLLIPVVAFDAKNYRLGYGAGFYDRTLAQMTSKPVTIGTAFGFQRVDDIRPHAYDLALDYIVTEEGVQRGR
jgi:5-formyltetrahydrofolate cyclo-ligase